MRKLLGTIQTFNDQCRAGNGACLYSPNKLNLNSGEARGNHIALNAIAQGLLRDRFIQYFYDGGSTSSVIRCPTNRPCRLELYGGLPGIKSVCRNRGAVVGRPSKQ